MTFWVARGDHAATTQEIMDALANGSGAMGANLDMGGFDIINVDDIISNVSGREIRSQAGGYAIRLESGSVLDVVINNVVEYTFAPTTLDLLANILSGINLMQGVTTTNQIDDTTSGWIFTSPTSLRMQIGGTNKMQINATTISIETQFIEGQEISDPAAPAANSGRLYFRDNGSGKTQLVVRFNTGAVQVIATEP
jgi:hypothetical protein